MLCLFTVLNVKALIKSELIIKYPFEQITFKLYAAAELNEQGEYVLQGDFKAYDVTLSADNWPDTAATLAAYVLRDALIPLKSAEVKDGSCQFLNLAAGVYLVMGEGIKVEGEIYTPVPFLVLVGQGKSIVVEAKYDVRPETEVLNYQVKKLWLANKQAERPTPIIIELLKDGVIDREVELNADNNWSYSWEALSGENWQVAEKDVPRGYTVLITREQTVFTVTNTADDYEQPATGDIRPLKTSLRIVTLALLGAMLGALKLKRE